MWDSKKYPVHKPEDADFLHLRSSLLRLQPMDREKAEKVAYDEYQRDQHMKAAAHHHAHSVAAKRGGGEQAAAIAALHGKHYVAHMQKLGLDPSMRHDGIEKMSRNLNLLDKFVPHHADTGVEIEHNPKHKK